MEPTAAPPTDPGPGPAANEAPATPPPGRGDGQAPLWRTIGALLLALVLVVGAVWIVPKLAGSASGSAAQTAEPSAAAALASGGIQPILTPAPTPDLSLPPASGGPDVSLPPGRTLGSAGAIAVVGNDGSLSLVDTHGGTVVLAPAGDATYAFPAWSPDGGRLAAIRYDATGTAILVFDAAKAIRGQAVEPVVIFRSGSIGPFYASWTPDGKEVSFLADEADALSLRLAPADGSAPLDGTGPGAKIRTGNPFYFDWIDNDRLLAHVGSGPDAFLGEIGRDGTPTGPSVKSPGDFRPAIVSRDGTHIGYVRAAASSEPASVVVAARDGSNQHSMPVFGTAGIVFDPKGSTMASIGPAKDDGSAFTIPIGPLRLIDADTGKIRTLLDGNVVSFWWSPDGRTIAALRVQPIAGEKASPGPAASAPTSPSASQSPAPTESASPGASGAASSSPGASSSPAPSQPPSEVRLVFVDVRSGGIRSQPVVEPGQLFIDQFLTYFDQYALSHQLWSPDSSSILIPVVDPGGTTHISALSPNGDPALTFDGAIAFWSP
jgi:hypothetical protein